MYKELELKLYWTINRLILDKGLKWTDIKKGIINRLKLDMGLKIHWNLTSDMKSTDNGQVTKNSLILDQGLGKEW